MLEFSVHGKWILAGEHSVLRGGSALVFPVMSRALKLTYLTTPDPLAVEFIPFSNDLHIGFWSVLEKGLQIVGRQRGDLKGNLRLESDIPVGAGMGASATLCVGLAKLFVKLKYLEENAVYNFAKSLEDLFHGQSSGVDVAVALGNKGLLFQPPEGIQHIQPAWTPQFYLSFCGRRAVTVDCVRKVETFVKENPELGEDLDLQMKAAVELAHSAFDRPGDTSSMVEALNMAKLCFKKWGLVSAELEGHMKQLSDAGALAVKPTGSGDGGFVLSLWEKEPPVDALGFPLISCF